MFKRLFNLTAKLNSVLLYIHKHTAGGQYFLNLQLLFVFCWNCQMCFFHSGKFEAFRLFVVIFHLRYCKSVNADKGLSLANFSLCFCSFAVFQSSTFQHRLFRMTNAPAVKAMISGIFLPLYKACYVALKCWPLNLFTLILLYCSYVTIKIWKEKRSLISSCCSVEFDYKGSMLTFTIYFNWNGSSKCLFSSFSCIQFQQ